MKRKINSSYTSEEEEEEAREGEREDFPSESLPQVPVTIYILF